MVVKNNLIEQLAFARNFALVNSLVVLWMSAGVLFLAWFKKKRGKNYKKVLLIGIGLVIIYLIIMALVTNSLMHPIYYM